MIPQHIHIGPRTVKTAAAVVLSLIIVHFYGTTTSRMTFAMLGAMAAVEPTFTDSLRSCMAQIVGVFFGAVMGIVLMAIPMHTLLRILIGMVAVITLYNTFRISFSPSLPCLIVVTLFLTPDTAPMEYALGRIWDTAIGLCVGLAINTLVLPYDNSRQIRDSIAGLDRELIRFLEEMFDGDNVLPDADRMARQVEDMARQLTIFTNQRLFLRRRSQKKEIASFEVCQRKARELLARMEILSRMEQPGQLTKENRRRLRACGAVIGDSRPLKNPKERDIVVNYHVTQILKLRRELLEALRD
ncbi:MAG: FUSC family protein [Oscillospiraceae bacterium]|nr:FUSC family protein [Oscillospiraceae bacterium]